MLPTLRLVSYNLLEGLRTLTPEDVFPRPLDPARVEAARQAVSDLDPDILVLNEALFSRPFAGEFTDFAQLFGYPHHAAALYDGAWGNAILSRHPISSAHEMRAADDRGGLVATLDVPGGRLAVATYHPHPQRKPAHKAADYLKLLSGLAGPIIVCGDMNCVSPHDAIDRLALLESFRRFSPAAETTLEQFLESGRHVFAALGQIGFADAVPASGRRYSIPTDLISSDKGSGIRIDHILANPGIRATSGAVEHSAASNRASDHHPVRLDFQFS